MAKTQRTIGDDIRALVDRYARTSPNVFLRGLLGIAARADAPLCARATAAAIRRIRVAGSRVRGHAERRRRRIADVRALQEKAERLRSAVRVLRSDAEQAKWSLSKRLREEAMAAGRKEAENHLRRLRDAVRSLEERNRRARAEDERLRARAARLNWLRATVAASKSACMEDLRTAGAPEDVLSKAGDALGGVVGAIDVLFQEAKKASIRQPPAAEPTPGPQEVQQ